MLFLFTRLNPKLLGHTLFDIDFPSFPDIFRTIGGLLCKFIYELIVNLYNLFMNIAQISFINQGDLKTIYQKITLILTMIMVFYVTFETVKYVIQPDTITDKERGASKIVTKMILVVLLIAMVPTIFEYSRKLQKGIIDSNLIANIFLNTTGHSSEDTGKNFSADLLSVFYVDNYPGGDPRGDYSGCNIPDRGAEPIKKCYDNGSTLGRVSSNLKDLRDTGTIPYLGRGLWEYNENDNNKYMIKFEWLLAFAVGAFIVYVLALYCIDAGVRVAQLAFLEIIAPIPIIGYLSPKKDGMFEKWVKQCITTYIDLFIRMMILYIVFLIANMLGTAYGNGTGRLFDGLNPAPSDTMKMFIYIALILGLFLFAQKAPKLLQEILPKGSSAASGNFGLKQKDRLSAVSRAAGAALGAAKFGHAVGRRIRASHNRNKKNGKKNPWFTKEGREQRAQERRNRHTARNTRDLANKSKNLDTAEKELRAANKKLQLAKNRNASQEEIAQLTNQRDKALNNYKKARSKFNDNEIYASDNAKYKVAGEKYKKADAEYNAALASGDQNRIAQATIERNKAKSEFDAETKNMQKYATSSKDSRAKEQASRNTMETSKNELEQAKQNLENIKNNGGTSTQIIAAQEEVDKKRQAFEKAQSEYLNNDHNVRQKLTDETQTKAEKAEEQVRKDENEKYHSITSDIIGAAGGTAHMIADGFKTKEMKDVIKNVRNAEQADVKRTQELYKYYDNGGTVGVSGLVDRKVTNYEKKHGYETAYQATTIRTQAMEPKIKELEAQSSLIKNIKSSADGAEDRLKSKIEDLKLTQPSSGIKTIDENGQEIYTTSSDGNTLAEVYRTYKGRAERAKSESDSAASNLQKFESSNADILNQDRDTLSLQKKKNYDTIKKQREALAAEAEKKSKASANANYAATLVQKNAARYEFTEILKLFAQGYTPEAIANLGIYDGPSINLVKDSLENVAMAKNNPVIVADLKNTLDANEFDAFMSGTITNFDTLDIIKNKALNAQAEYDRVSRELTEQKRSIETSRETQAQKAANDYNPQSGNK